MQAQRELRGLQARLQAASQAQTGRRLSGLVRLLAAGSRADLASAVHFVPAQLATLAPGFAGFRAAGSPACPQRHHCFRSSGPMFSSLLEVGTPSVTRGGGAEFRWTLQAPINTEVLNLGKGLAPRASLSTLAALAQGPAGAAGYLPPKQPLFLPDPQSSPCCESAPSSLGKPSPGLRSGGVSDHSPADPRP